MNDKTRDNLLYLGIALGVAAIGLAPLIYAIIRGGGIPEFPLKPAWLIGSTAILIAYLIQDLKRRRLRMRRLLSPLLCIAFVHMVITAAILRAVGRVPFLLLGVGVFVEAHVALLIIEKLVIRPNVPRT
jgi:hypothetical protein